MRDSHAGPPHKRQKGSASIADFDDEELLQLAQSQLPIAQAAPHKAHAEALQAHPLLTYGAPVPPVHSSTQEALDDAEEIAELVRLANSTLQPDLASGDADEMPESSTDAGNRGPEASTSYSQPSAPSWSGAEIEGESMSVTLKDGRRAFCRLHDRRQAI